MPAMREEGGLLQRLSEGSEMAPSGRLVQEPNGLFAAKKEYATQR